jgi:glycerol-3-phosphate acyltransferase PlsX
LARIALDAMGGDFAPDAAIAGALHAILELPAEHTLQLVGPTDVVRERVAALSIGDLAPAAAHANRIEVIEAPDVIEMSDKPSAAMRSKPNSSMVIGLKLQTEGRSDAFISAGNTGAQMAASTVLLKLHGAIKRPAIASVFPTARQPVVVLDAGANVDCSAEELVDFARLGAVYAEDILGRDNPSIGLLSIGEEAEKGNAVVKEANQLLAAAGLNFQGNVEGRDLPKGESDRGPFDVVVCDGFVGNVMLKFYESLAPVLLEMVAASASVDRAALLSAFKHLDYSEHGGAPLLGVRGVSIISHGKSSPVAVKNAIRVALRAVESRMNDHIGRRLAADEATAAAAAASPAPGA